MVFKTCNMENQNDFTTWGLDNANISIKSNIYGYFMLFVRLLNKPKKYTLK